MYNLFLDDERDPKDVTWIDLPPYNWVVVRTFDQFVSTIKERGIPETVSFDHDIMDTHYKEYHRAKTNGGIINYDLVEKTGYHAAKWLAELCIDKNVPIPTYFVHSWNNIGKQNIVSILECAKRMLTNL